VQPPAFVYKTERYIKIGRTKSPTVNTGKNCAITLCGGASLTRFIRLKIYLTRLYGSLWQDITSHGPCFRRQSFNTLQQYPNI
jgi:hypothetical protein